MTRDGDGCRAAAGDCRFAGRTGRGGIASGPKFTKPAGCPVPVRSIAQAPSARRFARLRAAPAGGFQRLGFAPDTERGVPPLYERAKLGIGERGGSTGMDGWAAAPARITPFNSSMLKSPPFASRSERTRSSKRSSLAP